MNQTLSPQQCNLTGETRQFPATPAIEKLLPLSEVESRSGFKSSFIYQLIKQGKFPPPVKIGNSSRWRESEIQQWIHTQIESSSSSKHSG